MDSITQEQADGLCKEWQEFLRLKDWTVRVVLVKDTDYVAECQVLSWKYREAVINICTLDTLKANLMCVDPEVSIVHELQHLFTKGFEDLIEEETWERDAMETMVEMNAQALVHLKRLAVHNQILKEAVQRELLAVLPSSDSYVKDNYSQKIIIGKRPKAA